MPVQPYLFLDGRCEEAIDFYKKALGAKVEMMMRFKESPDQSMVTPGSENKIMHSSLKIRDTVVMMSDGECGGRPQFQGFSLSINAKDDAEAKSLFAKLGEGGQVRMPLTKTFFSSSFGMLADKFGIGWMVLVAS